MMEKRTPQCDLAVVRGLVKAGKVRTTYSARTASRDLEELIGKALLEKVGTTGKGAYHLLAKGAIKGSKGS